MSSTWLDLQPEREAVEEALQTMRSTRFIGMEYFASRDEAALGTSLAELDRCQLYVGIFGGRHGTGITEQEYRRARGRGLPCLIFLKHEDAINQRDSDPALHERLATLKSELSTNHLASTFRNPYELAMRVVAEVHNWLFDRQLTQGMAALPGELSTRVGNFLAEYIGTPEHPVPFGGRAHELDVFDQWLDREEQRPYLLLAGPAGRGKSALLVRWSQRVSQRDDVAVVFFPVSVRFRTNLAAVAFSAIASRLALLHGEPVSGTADTPAEVWRGLVSNYLARALPDGRKLLLILDGADEAADWEVGPDLFPASAGSRVRVLMSARYLAGDVDSSSWIARLGWAHTARGIDLAPLSPRALADVVKAMGGRAVDLAGRPDLIAELYRLTEGDPLLVRLHVADLTAASLETSLTRGDLSDVRPGLDGYFSRWWEEQRRLWGTQTPLREPAVQAILNVLACALGPLLQVDLLRSLPPQLPMSVWTLEEALRPLNRFIVGDGATHGFSLSHPRLAGYFYDRLARAGQARQQEDVFVRWGEETLVALNDGTLAPADASPYIVRYFRAHLERSGHGSKALMTLICRGWLAAWDHIDKGSYSGFLGDLERTWLAGERTDSASLQRGQSAPHLGEELLCALCQSSINSLAVAIPVRLLAALMVKGAWSVAQVLAHGTRIPNRGARLRLLLDLLGHAPDEGRPLFLAAAFDLVRRFTTDRSAASAFREIMLALARDAHPGGDVDALCRLLRALARVLGYLPSDHWLTLTNIAMEVVETRLHGPELAQALAALCEHVPSGIQGARSQSALVAARIRMAQANAGSSPDVDRIASEAQVPSIQKPKVDLLYHLRQIEPAFLRRFPERPRPASVVESQAPENSLIQLTRDARRLSDWQQRTSLLLAFAARFDDFGEPHALSEVIDFAHEVSNANASALALHALAGAKCLSEPARDRALTEALKAYANTFGDSPELRQLINGLIERSAAPEALFVQALEVLRKREQPFGPWRHMYFERLVPKLPLSLRPGALSVAVSIYDRAGFERVLTEVFGYDPSDPSAVEMLNAVSDIGDPGERVSVLRVLIPGLSSALLSQVIGMAEQIADERVRYELVQELVPHLPEPMLPDAIRLARQFSINRARALGICAEQVPLPEARIILLEMLESCGQLSDGGCRALQRFSELDSALFERVLEVATPAQLGEIAFSLAPAMLVRAAAATHSIRDQGSCALAMGTFAILVADTALAERAFASALDGAAPSRLRWLLAHAFPHMSAPAQSALISQCLDEVEGSSWNDEEEKRTLAAATPWVTQASDAALIRAFKRETGYGDVALRVSVYEIIVPALPKPLQCQAVSWLLSVPDEGRRAPALVSIADNVHPSLLPDLLEASQDVADEDVRSQLLMTLAPRLDSTGVLRAIELAARIRTGSVRALTLASLASHIDDEQRIGVLQRALAALDDASVAEIPDAPLVGLLAILPEGMHDEVAAVLTRVKRNVYRAKLIGALALALPDTWFEMLFAAAVRLDPYSCSIALRRVAVAAPCVLLDEAVAAARALDDGFERILAMARVAQRLPDEARRALLLAALDDAPSILDPVDRAQAFVLLSSAFYAEHPQQTLSQITAHVPDPDKARVLAALASTLPSAHQSELLPVVRSIAMERERSAALCALIPWFSDSALDELVASCAAFRSDIYKAGVLRAIARRVPAALPGAVFGVADRITKDHVRAELFCELAPWAVGPGPAFDALWTNGLAAIERQTDEHYRGELLVASSRALPDRFVTPALQIVALLGDEELRANVLIAFAQYGPDAVLSGTLAMARGIDDGRQRAIVLAAISSRLGPEQRDAQVEVALQLAALQHSKAERADAYRRIALNSRGSALAIERALAAAAMLGRGALVANYVCDLAPWMEARGWARALGVVAELTEETDRWQALAGLVPHLPESWQCQSLALAAGLRDERLRYSLLCAGAPYFSGAALGQALTMSLALESEVYRAGAINELAPFSDQELLASGLAGVLGIAGEYVRWEAVRRMMHHLPGPLLAKVLAKAGSFAHEPYRVRLLQDIAPILPEALIDQALAVARGIKDPFHRAVGLRALLDRAPNEQRRRLLGELGESVARIDSAAAREEMLTDLVSKLRIWFDADTETSSWEAFLSPNLQANLHARMAALASGRATLTADIPSVRAKIREAMSSSEPWQGGDGWRRLTPEAIPKILDTLKRSERDGERLQQLRRLAPYLQTSLFEEALEVAGAFVTDEHRREALCALGPHLPPDLFDAAWAKASSLSARSCADVLGALVPRLLTLDGSALHGAWAQVLHTCSGWPRYDFLGVVCAAAPIVQQLGGQQGVRAAMDAIQTVSSWWP